MGLFPASQTSVSGLCSSELPLSFSLLLLLLQTLGAGAQNMVVLQAQGPLKVTSGDTVHLNCMIWFGPPGGVRWYKGSDRSQPPVYSDKAAVPPRVTRFDPGSSLDYSIRISDIQPEDAGTYYCVKYKAGIVEMEYKSGEGTEVTVVAIPSQPSITGPPSRVDSGALVTFTCSSDGFFPRDITVTWLKDGRFIPASWTLTLPPRKSTLYHVVSTVEATLTEKDVKSELICQIQHSTLPSPLRQSFKLGDALRVAPKMSMDPSHLVDVTVNHLVTITCSAKGFYPNDTSLMWRENGSETDLGTSGPITQETDGTFSVKSFLEANATEPRNHSVFTCYAVRNSQMLDHANVTLKIHREKGHGYSANTDQWLSSNPGLWVVFVLNKIGGILFLSFLFLRKMLSGTDKRRQRQSKE